jgi:hypothetical protein
LWPSPIKCDICERWVCFTLGENCFQFAQLLFSPLGFLGGFNEAYTKQIIGRVLWININVVIYEVQRRDRRAINGRDRRVINVVFTPPFLPVYK